MGRLLLVVVLVVLGGGAYIYSDLPSNTAVVGDLAPDFQLEDTKGKQISLASLRGKVVLVNFWATWCPPCIEEMPSMEGLHEAMSSDNFVMLAINVEENGRSAVPAFLQKTPYTFPIFYDDKGIVQQRYGVFKFPESFIVGKDGKIIEKIIGPHDWSSPATIQYLMNLTKG